MYVGMGRSATPALETLQQILGYEQCAAEEQWYSQDSERLFESDSSKSWIDLHLLESHQIHKTRLSAEKYGRYHEYPRPGAETPIEESASDNSIHPPPAYDSTLEDDNQVIRCPLSEEAEGSVVMSRRIRSPDELRRVSSETNTRTRLCFVRQYHSFGRLRIHKDLFEALLSAFQILPRFREFALSFGFKETETEVAHPPLKFRTLFPPRTTDVAPTNSGFECAYAIRYVDLNKRRDDKPWSLRQTAVYHRYDAQVQTSTWCCVAASEQVETCLDQFAEAFQRCDATTSFGAHAMLLDTALVGWRPFMINLTERINQQSDKILVASTDERQPLSLVDIDDRQSLKDLEDEVLDIILALDSLFETIDALSNKFDQYRHLNAELTGQVIDGFDNQIVAQAFQERRATVNIHRRKIQNLYEKVKGMISLLSSILDLGNGSSLKMLAAEATSENIAMRRLVEKSTQDAAAVKVLTVITLIFLPATVVSNFFSSEFVTTNSRKDVNTVVLTSNAWLFAAISVPLTLVTLFIWWAWIKLQGRSSMKWTNQRITPLSKIWTPQPKLDTLETKIT
ncbi:uncharacterized protein KY384_001202 [Bacidia gigantensis]|uniref:uncharacterized protein n=1 Tax=Bacidia gigantensis TaxID=2732470 RepID=UPI001D0529F7|nr:uncharacterized protein KY384_001202 [Bacidia gigantensis]KAG8534358.1 hypothetical protein KY384_001202 [Bacidia gigantensis]